MHSPMLNDDGLETQQRVYGDPTSRQAESDTLFQTRPLKKACFDDTFQSTSYQTWGTGSPSIEMYDLQGFVSTGIPSILVAYWHSGPTW